MKRMLIVPAILLVTSGCATSRVSNSAMIDQRLTAAQSEYLSKTISPLCPPPGNVPSAECGLETQKVDKTAIKKFVRTQCGGKDSLKCGERFREMMVARMAIRYKYANWDEAGIWCRANPDACGNLTSLELHVLESHNNHLFELARLAMQKEAAEMQREQLAEPRSNIWRALATGLQSMGQSIQQQPRSINCTSNQIGTYTYTNCH